GGAVLCRLQHRLRICPVIDRVFHRLVHYISCLPVVRTWPCHPGLQHLQLFEVRLYKWILLCPLLEIAVVVDDARSQRQVPNLARDDRVTALAGGELDELPRRPLLERVFGEDEQAAATVGWHSGFPLERGHLGRPDGPFPLRSSEDRGLDGA